MIFESLAAYRAATFAPKVAIAGAGPAGITIARKLAAAGIPTVVFEAGESEFSLRSQEFYRGDVHGDPYFPLDETRLRHFGGSSNHWAGWCRPLDDVDFEPKAWASDTGWPIRRAEIEPFFGEVRDILDLPPFRADEAVSGDLSWVQLIKSQPVRFGRKYRDEIAHSDMIALVLDTYVTSLAADGTAVSALNLWSAGGDTATVACDYAAVCTGGLENARLLLWSNELANGAAVPRPAALGAYFMEHPHFQCGNAVLTDAARIETDADGEAFFSPTPKAMQRKQILNFGIRMVEMPYDGVKRFVANLACTAPRTAEWLSEGLGQRLRCAAQLHMSWEQQPLRRNRIALNPRDRDAAGVPILELHLRKSELDRRTILEGTRLFGQALAQQNLGRVRLADWLVRNDDYPTDGEELAGNHHMGGTRMSDNPATGVVDRNCRVHGMRNLFVGGSSVFATSGQAPPTTTITALACRLAEHIAGAVRADEAVASVGAPLRASPAVLPVE